MRVLIILLLFFSNSILSQVELINAKKPIDIENKSNNEADPLQYFDVDENDILWSKVVYEFIDLNEKLNFPLLFPTDEESQTFRIGRKSMWVILKEHILTKIDEYKKTVQDETWDVEMSPDNLEIYSDDTFEQSKKISVKDINDLISYEQVSRREAAGFVLKYVMSNQVGGYNIKGIWFFDKKASELKYRLLGIQPVVANTEELKGGVANPKLDKPTFWIWYPSIREELNKHLVFNERNNENRITFDALLINRRFNSYIYKYDNMYGDRSIKDYIVPRPGESEESYRIRFILESERIKKEILDFENDMWGY
jgi:gliding motility associated protien GldN